MFIVSFLISALIFDVGQPTQVSFVFDAMPNLSARTHRQEDYIGVYIDSDAQCVYSETFLPFHSTHTTRVYLFLSSIRI